MLLKSTQNSFTSVNILKTSNTESSHFLTTDKNGKIEIFEKSDFPGKENLIESNSSSQLERIRNLPFKLQSENNRRKNGGSELFSRSNASRSVSNQNKIQKVFSKNLSNSIKSAYKESEITSNSHSDTNLSTSAVIDAENVIISSGKMLHIYKLNYNSNFGIFEPENLVDLKVGGGGLVSCVSREKSNFKGGVGKDRAHFGSPDPYPGVRPIQHLPSPHQILPSRHPRQHPHPRLEILISHAFSQKRCTDFKYTLLG